MPIDRLVEVFRLTSGRLSRERVRVRERKSLSGQPSVYALRGFAAVALNAARSACFWSGRSNIRTDRLI